MSEHPIVAIVHACAPNDANGNPRRAFVGLDKSGSIARVTDEGYAGRPDWVRARERQGTYALHVVTTPAEWLRPPTPETDTPR